jgi:hypothetical protein
MFNTDPGAKARKQAERDTEAARKEAARESAVARSNAEQAERQRQKERESYLKTPVGQADTALQSGQRFFQFTAPVSQVSGKATDAGLGLLALGVPSFPSASSKTRRFDSTDVLGQIEELGWRLEHVGYVFVETGEVSRGKVMSSGGVSRTNGYVEGIYLFRRSEQPAGPGHV